MVKFFWVGVLLVWFGIPHPAAAADYVRQKTFDVTGPGYYIKGIGGDARQQVYVLDKLTADATTYTVFIRDEDDLSLRSSFDTGISTPVHMSVGEFGTVDVVYETAGYKFIGWTPKWVEKIGFKRFNSFGTVLAGFTVEKNTSLNWMSSAVDPINGFVYIGYRYEVPAGAWWYGILSQYDFNGNLVGSVQLPGRSIDAGTCWTPSLLTTNRAGDVFVGDAQCEHVLKYGSDLTLRSDWAAVDWNLFPGSWRPKAMWTDAGGDLYIVQTLCDGGGGCLPGIARLNPQGAERHRFYTSAYTGFARDQRIVYTHGDPWARFSRYILNDPPSAAVPAAPWDTVDDHLAASDFWWQQSADVQSDPVEYELYLGTASVGLSPWGKTTAVGLRIEDLSFGVTYYWQVTARDSYKGYPLQKVSSMVASFTKRLVNAAPGPFAVVAGTGTAVTRDASVRLAWEPAADPDGDGVTYAVSWSSGGAAGADVLTTTGTALRFTGLTFGATYFWSARAFDLYDAESLLDGGRQQAYHPVFKNSAPAMPGTYTSGDQLYEVHGETTTVLLSWAAAPDADKDTVEYAVYLGESPESLLLVSTQSDRSYSVGPFDVGTGFYWRVRATDPYGAFTDGKIGHASTVFVNDPPEAFSVIAGTGVFVTRTPSRELVWESAADPEGDAVGYALHFSSDATALPVVHAGSETRWTMSGLTFGTTYYWSVLARDAYDGVTANSGGVQPLRLEFRNAPPAAPAVLAGAGVFAQHAAAPELRLAWSATADPDGDPVAYRLHFGTDRTSLPEVLDSTATHYDVPEPSFGTTYYWRVYAYDPYGGETATSAQETRIDLQNEPPGAFSVLSGAGAVETRETSWPLAWSGAFDPDGDPVSYELEIATDPVGLVTVRVSTATSFDLTFEYGLDYYWRVTARDGFGGERVLPMQTFSPAFENSAPSAPDVLGGSGILFQHTTSPRARLEWSAAWDLDGDPVGYRLWVGTDPARMAQVQDSTATAYDLPAPVFGATYYWQVDAYDPYGGEVSTGLQELRLELQNVAPSQFSATSGAGDLATRETTWPLAWTAALDADGDAVTYELAVASGTGPFQTVQVSSARVYNLAFSFGTEYAWTVTALDGFGGETRLAPQSFRPTFYNTPPPAPGILAGAGVSAQHTYTPSAELVWSAVTDAEDDTVSYRLELGTAPETLAVVSDNSATRYALPRPTQGSTHYWRVTAHDEYGAGSSTAVQELRFVLANEPPQAFPVLTGAGDLITRSTTTELSWSEALDPDGDIVTYELRLGTATGGMATVQASESRSYSLSFEIGQTFYWTVTARDSFGGERALQVQTLRTQFRNSAPTAPVLQTRTGTIPHHGFTPSLALFWEPSTDPDGDAVYYRLLYGTDPNSLLDIGEISLGHELDGMSVERAYYFQLVAVDSFGAKTAGDVQWVYFDFVNSAPGAFDATGGVGEFITRATTMTLSWTPSADLDGDPVTYRVLFGTATTVLAPLGDYKETSALLEDLAFGASYFWSVEAFDGFGATTTIQGGVKPFRLTFKNSPPPAPQVLAGSGLDFQHTLQPETGLRWSSVSDADGDPVGYRLSVGTDIARMALVRDSTATTYDLPDPLFGTTYYWQVTAYDPYGGEASTGVQELRLELQNAAPGQFSATSGTGDLATRETAWPLAWTAAFDSDGDAVAYEPAVASGTGPFQTVQVSSARVYYLAFTFGVEYVWTVTARDGFGGATALAAQSFRPTFYNTPPSAPKVLAGAGVSAQHTYTPAAELAWSTVADAEGDMVNYLLELGASPEDLVTVQVGTATSFSLASPEQGSTYYWRVSAVDTYGAGSTTAIQELRLALANEPPGAFAVLSGAGPVSTRETSWTLSWSSAPDPDGDPVTYELGLSTDQAGMATVLVSTAASFELPFEYGTDYYWQVTARDGFGGERTLPVQAFSPAFENAAPDVPTILSGSGVLAQHTFTPSVQLAWGEVFDADGDAVGYRLELGTAPESMATVQDGPPTSYALPSPGQGTTHYWRVSAYDEYGAASTSRIQELHLELQNAAPGPLAALSGTGTLVTRTTITTLAWSSAFDADGDPVVYTLRLGTAPDAMNIVQEGAATSHGLAFEYDVTYYWSVATRDGFGGTSLLPPQSLSPSFLNSPPSAPTNKSQTGIVAFHGFSPELALFWSPSFDPEGDAVSYSVRIGTEASSLETVNPISLGHRLKALRLDTAYFYEIVATDAYGARSSSGLDWVFYEFTNTAPEPFTKSAGAGRFVTRTTTMTLAWSAAADLDGDPVAYQVLAGTAASSLDVVESLDERSAVLASLDFDTTYYWSARAFDGFGGTRTLTGAPFAFFLEFLNNPPPAPASTSGAGLSRQHTLAPVAELAWTTVADPEGDPVAYRLFFGTVPFGLALVQDAASTSYTLASPALGATYYWRVEAYDPYGGVSSTPLFDHRIELRNAPPAVFSASSGSSDVATRETSWPLVWSATTDPDGDILLYELAVSTDSAASAIVQTSTATSYLLPIVHGSTYYWDVRAFDPLGGERRLGPQTMGVSWKNSPPAAAPILGGSGVFSQHTLTPSARLAWSTPIDSDGDPVTHRLFLGTDTAALQPVQDSTATSYLLPEPVFGATYYWKLESYDPYGGRTPTQLQTLRVELDNGAPAPFLAVSGAGTVATRETTWALAWSAAPDPDGDPVTYTLALSTDAGALQTVQTGPMTAYALPIVYGATYYWEVRARDGFGGETGLYQQTFRPTFYNTAPPAPPILSGSGQSAQHTFTPSAELAWGAVLDAEADEVAYRLELGTSPDGLAAVQDGTWTSYTLPTPGQGTTHYWRVTVHDEHGAASSSAVQELRLELQNASPGPFAAISGAGPVSTRETSWPLAWSAAFDPDGDPLLYELAISTDRVSLAIVQASTTTSFHLPFQYNKDYFWRVTARDSFGGERTLPVQTFSPVFENSPPAAPTILGGVGVLEQHTHTPGARLAWSAAADADGDLIAYRLLLGEDRESLVGVQDSTATFFELPEPAFGTTYYWQVAAYDPYEGEASTVVQELRIELTNESPAPFAAVSGAGPVSTRETAWTLAWSTAFDADGDAIVYELALSTDAAALDIIQRSTATSFRLSFEYGVDYYWRVTARDPFGGERTLPVQTFSPVFENSPPSVPRNLSNAGLTPFHGLAPSQSFFWEPSFDPDGDAIKYDLYFGTDTNALAPIETISLGHTIDGLAVDTAYFFKLVAADPYGGVSDSPLLWVFYEFSNNAPGGFGVVEGSGTIATRRTSSWISWTPARDPDGDAVGYQLFVGTSAGTMARHADLAGTTTLLENLVFDTTYYWLVESYDPLGGRTPIAGGVQTLVHIFKNAPPAPVSIVEGSGVSFQHTYSPKARLGWADTADPDGDTVRYRLSLGTVRAAMSEVLNSATTGYELPDPVLGTTYYWQVAAYDPYGGVTPTEVQALRIELANEAPWPFTAVSGAGPFATRQTSWTLAWSAAFDPDGDPMVYELAVSTDPAGLAIVQMSTATNYALPFDYGVNYHWQVRARDGFGGERALGLQTFRPIFYNTGPLAPAIMSGAGVSAQHTFTPSAELVWGEVFDAEGDAVGYRLVLGTAPESMAAVQDGPPTSYALPAPGQGTTHYWRVIAHDEYGAASSSGVQELHLELRNVPPGSFAAVSGEGPVSTRETSWTLAWSEATDPDGDALIYELRLSTDPAAPPVVQASTATSYRFPFEYGVDYYWQVTARDPFGGERTPPARTFSPTFKNSPPAIPAALDGGGVAFQHTHTPQARLEWSTAADPDGDAVGYRLFLGTTPLALPEVQESSATAYDLPEPLFGTTYYWEVVAYDPYGAAGSTARQELRLELQNDPPNAFSALAGTGLVHTRDTRLDLEWSAASDPDDDPVLYELKLSTDPAALAMVRVSTHTHFRLTFEYGTDYYWQVTAQDPFGGERTLPVQTLSPAFKNSPPAIPTALDGVGVVFQHTHTPQARLEWSAAGDPDGDPVGYRLSVGTDPARMALVRDSTETVYDLPAPLFGATYYWQVNAYDPYGGEAATGVHDIRIELQNGAPGTFAAVSGTGTIPTRETAWTLAWSDALDPDGDIVIYELELSTNPTGLARVQLSTATRFVLPFEYGADYYWRVTARDGFGGERALLVQAFSPVFRNAAPGVPTNLSKTGTLPFHGRSPSLSFFWERAADPDGDAVAYHLHFGTDSERLAELGVVDLGHTMENLAVDKAYYYSIVAVDRWGARSGSPVHWVFFEYSNLPPGAFEIVAGSGTIVTRATSAGLSWTAAEDPDGDPVTYRILVGTRAADLRLLSETRQTSAVLQDIVFGTTHYWDVVAFDALGGTSTLRNGPQSLVHLFSNAPPDRPAITSALGPIAFHAKAPAYSLAWEGGSDTEGDPVTFEVSFGTYPAAADGIELPFGTRRYEPQDLRPDTTYYVRVMARDGYGAVSAAVAGSLLFEFANDAPTPPRYTEGHGAQHQRTLTPGVTVAWEVSFDSDGDPVRYALYFSTQPDSAVPALDTSGTSAFMGGLAVGATYYWRVAAYDSYARIFGERASVVVTLENGAPRPIRYLSPASTRTRETAYPIRWEDSGDPDGEPVRYTLELGPGEDAMAEVSLTSPTSYALPIRYGATYYYRVSAADAFGSRTVGDIQTLTVEFLNDPPEPISLVAPFMEQPNIATMNGGVELAWRLVSNPQGDPITYEVYLGESPAELNVVARVAFDGSEYRLAGFGPAQVSVSPRLVVEGDRVRLHLDGLEYYRPYYLKVVAFNEFGAKSETDIQRFTLQAADGFPAAYNYPNPFNPLRGGTNIVFNAPAGGFRRAIVSVYSEMQDLLFRREYAAIPVGVSEVQFDGRDRFGRALFNGSYICRVRFEGPDHEEVFYLLVVK